MTIEYGAGVNPDQSASSIDIGKVLRQKRLTLSYTEQQVAIELKLSVEKVIAIESNQFDKFRSLTFARGYLKSYCRVLGLEQTPLIKAFDEQQNIHESNIRPVDNVNTQASVRDPIVVITSVVIIAIIAFVVFWWPSFSSVDENEVASNEAVATEGQVIPENTDDNSSKERNVPVEKTAPDLALTPSSGQPKTAESKAKQLSDDFQVETLDELDLSALEEIDVDQDEASNSQVVTGLSAETMALLADAGLNPDEVADAVRKEASTNIAPQEQISEEATYSNDIEIAFSADCWVQIRDNTGRTLFSGVKSAGSTLQLNGEAPFRVTLGYAPGVTEFTYKGEAFDFSSHIRNDLARFELE